MTNQEKILAWMKAENIVRFAFEGQWRTPDDVRDDPSLAEKYAAAYPGFYKLFLRRERRRTLRRLRSAKTYRAFYPHELVPDDIVGPILAANVVEAMQALNCSISALQVVENGCWVWVDALRTNTEQRGETT